MLIDKLEILFNQTISLSQCDNASLLMLIFTSSVITSSVNILYAIKNKINSSTNGIFY